MANVYRLHWYNYLHSCIAENMDDAVIIMKIATAGTKGNVNANIIRCEYEVKENKEVNRIYLKYGSGYFDISSSTLFNDDNYVPVNLRKYYIDKVLESLNE